MTDVQDFLDERYALADDLRRYARLDHVHLPIMQEQAALATRIDALEALAHSEHDHSPEQPSSDELEVVHSEQTILGDGAVRRKRIEGERILARLGTALVEECVVLPGITAALTGDRYTGVQAYGAALTVRRSIVDGATSSVRTTGGGDWLVEQLISRNPRGAAVPRGQTIQAENSGFGVIRGLVSIIEPDDNPRQAVGEDHVSIYGTSPGVRFEPVPGRAPDEWDVLLYGGESVSGSGVMSDEAAAGSPAEDRVIEFAPGVRALLLETGQYGMGINAGKLIFRTGCEVLIICGRLAGPSLGGLYGWEHLDGAQVTIEIEAGANVQIYASRRRLNGDTYNTATWIPNDADLSGEFTARGRVEDYAGPRTFAIPGWAREQMRDLGYVPLAGSVLAAGQIEWEPLVAITPTRNP